MSILTHLISHKCYLIFSFALCPQGTLLCLRQHTHKCLHVSIPTSTSLLFPDDNDSSKKKNILEQDIVQATLPAYVTSRLSALVRQWRALTQSPRLARQDKRGGGQRQVIALSADVGMCQQAVGTIVVCSDFI